jgi:cytochrome c oxidase subunit 2
MHLEPVFNLIASAWWLPPDHSEHGGAFDQLFRLIFWISVVVAVGVQIGLVWCLVGYRRRPGRHAAFIHGSIRLEVIWTVATALILFVLTLLSTRVWSAYWKPLPADQADVVRVLVVGQQFKWNVVYPGPDGRLGRYLVYPKPTDRHWPGGERFRGVDGPADLPFADAITAINAYIDQINPLGKDMDDPAGRDDDWRNALARDLTVPAGKQVELSLGSRDVIHDLSIPSVRVKSDIVPGTIGKLSFVATTEGRFDLLCQQLCGAGHYTMVGKLVVVSPQEFAQSQSQQVGWAK